MPARMKKPATGQCGGLLADREQQADNNKRLWARLAATARKVK